MSYLCIDIIGVKVSPIELQQNGNQSITSVQNRDLETLLIMAYKESFYTKMGMLVNYTFQRTFQFLIIMLYNRRWDPYLLMNAIAFSQTSPGSSFSSTISVEQY